jgi:hypothetical protein
MVLIYEKYSFQNIILKLNIVKQDLSGGFVKILKEHWRQFSTIFVKEVVGDIKEKFY